MTKLELREKVQALIDRLDPKAYEEALKFTTREAYSPLLDKSTPEGSVVYAVLSETIKQLKQLIKAQRSLDRPVPGVQYRLFGGPNDAAISNGNSWAESRIE